MKTKCVNCGKYDECVFVEGYGRLCHECALAVKPIQKNVCRRCGYVWESRISRPRFCPRCKSPYWDKPYKYKRRLRIQYTYTTIYNIPQKMEVSEYGK